MMQPNSLTKKLNFLVDCFRFPENRKQMAIEKESEEKIFKAAQAVFQEKGFDGARMQEIADRAGINKSMLHYYYRNKDNLFFEVFMNAISRFMPGLFAILASEKSLEEKIPEVVGYYHSLFMENLNLPSFIIYEINKNPQRFREVVEQRALTLPPVFVEQVQAEITAGRMADVKPQHVLINIVSMVLFPVIAKNVVQAIFRLDDADYKEFLNERRSLVSGMILKGVAP